MILSNWLYKMNEPFVFMLDVCACCTQVLRDVARQIALGLDYLHSNYQVP